MDSPPPTHCIESAATESPAGLVKNAYPWDPLHYLLTILGGALESAILILLGDSKSHQSLRAMENLQIPGRATHLQK